MNSVHTITYTADAYYLQNINVQLLMYYHAQHLTQDVQKDNGDWFVTR